MINHSSKVVTDGLILYLDMANRKSWKGEPTTNMIPYPERNGRFTTSNDWGTYNTNQHSWGAFFSIGTVASVVDNIVTMTAAHSLRTFDVIRPQTTGGGLTANVDYQVKKISSTQFSLHAWNNQNNGSVGYIQTTGYNKAHDSIALDQRIAINATSFPTMWWGYPHLPNQHLVKEIKTDSGPEGQNSMRLHIPGIDGQADGLAYGVYVPVNLGDVINVSYLCRANRADKSALYTTYFGPGAAYSASIYPGLEWTKVTHQWTASVAFQFYQYWFPAGTTDTRYWIDICDLQVEVNTKSGSTPFTITPRTNSNCLLDMTGNDQLRLEGTNYIYSPQQLTINNTNDSFINQLNSTKYRMGTNNFTVCSVVKQIDNSYNILLEARSSATLIGYFIVANYPSAGKIQVFLNHSSDQQPYHQSVATLPVGQIQHIAVSVNRVLGTISIYLNGEVFEIISGIHTNSISPTQGDIYRIGYDHGGSTTNMEIYQHQHYNRALSKDEVLINFNAIRGRYGI